MQCAHSCDQLEQDGVLAVVLLLIGVGKREHRRLESGRLRVHGAQPLPFSWD
jgi:hypothetical protein|tara:strand:+ start:2758 stop:2913 length:156 start_codon:yes stop_codon:yes gene_type:complete